MHIELIEITTPGLAYACLGGFLVAFSMVSLLVKEKLYINEVLLGTTFGILMGPYAANIIDPRSWGTSEEKVTLEVTRVVLATGLFIIGVELPKNYLWKHLKGLLVMVVPTMAVGWVIIAGFLKALFQQLNFVSCLAISACLTPTDPIICATIVGGKFAVRYVPLSIRQILSAESAVNDGMAYPFLTIALFLTVESSKSTAIGKWIIVGVLYQVVLGIILGGFLGGWSSTFALHVVPTTSITGFVFSFLMKRSLKNRFIDRESYLAQQLALALLTMGVADTLGCDDLLAAFAAGSTISWDGDFNHHIENEVFASIVDLVLNCACFIYIGAWLPFKDFSSEALGIEVWRLVVLFLIVIFLRRIPALLALYMWIPEVQTWKEALFCGHFGPVRCNMMGVGAVFVSSLAVTKLPKPNDPPQNQAELLAATIRPIVSFVVFGSIIIHGLSVVVLSLTFGLRSRTRTLTSPEFADVQGLPLASSGLASGSVRDSNSVGGTHKAPDSVRRIPSKRDSDDGAAIPKEVRFELENGPSTNREVESAHGAE
ncbi:hypothetical protein V5O48_005529 [Marasmius crinis-equi]|uniref:Cation/H+ exchanger transmembrane domain-containing protein n=1 Tax=Marasmius crinis-equi TaxID=585013 RepID=A0ABR3FM41_9AGAR